MADLGALVEELIGGRQAEIAEHDLHHGPEPVEGGPQRHAGEAVLGNGHGQHPLRPALQRAAGGAADAAAQAMHILPHDDDPGIARHVAGQHIGHGGAEFDLRQLLGPVIRKLAESLARKLAQIAADAGVDAGRVREESWRHPKLIAARHLLGEMGSRLDTARALASRRAGTSAPIRPSCAGAPGRWRWDRGPAIPSPPPER
jgi:hypothetical protein